MERLCDFTSSVNKLSGAFKYCRNFYHCHETACVSVKEFCVCFDAKVRHNASLANVNRHTVKDFLHSVTHYHTLNARALAGAVNAALAWWRQLWTRLYLDSQIWPSVVTQLPGFTKAVAMAATLINGCITDGLSNGDNIVHCPENLTSALDFNSKIKGEE